MRYVVGVDLGGTKIYTALTDFDGNIINEIVIPTEAKKGEKSVLEKITYTIDEVIKGIDTSLIEGIGIGVPGVLDFKNGIIVESPNLPFKNFNIASSVTEKYNIEVFLDNDANVATIGEYVFGAGKGSRNMVYVTVSTGIGGGAVLNGALYRGNTGNALEVGHMTLKKDGPKCGCGNLGCAESISSGTAIMKRAEKVILENTETSLKNYKNISSKEIFIEASKGDKVSNEILDYCLSYLGITVANILSIFDPEALIIGGGVINGGDIVMEKIKEEVDKRVFKTISENCKISKALLGGKAGVLGAAALAIQERKNRDS